MMEMSAAINELATALSKAQGQIDGAAKRAANPFFKSKYADLESVWDACRKPLTENGLAILQSPHTETVDGVLRVSVQTLLTHTSGQWISDTITVSANEDSPQALGSCVTYLRRYSLQSFAGVAPTDDDGEAAEGRSGGKLQQSKPAVSRKPVGFDEWLAALTFEALGGSVKLRAAWREAKQEFRDYLTVHEPKTLADLKERGKQSDLDALERSAQ